MYGLLEPVRRTTKAEWARLRKAQLAHIAERDSHQGNVVNWHPIRITNYYLGSKCTYCGIWVDVKRRAK